jgi:hypothetical protein
VITAAHCLPHLPTAHPASFNHERTYRSLLGPLGERPTVDAECLLVNPIVDLAVLGSVENQWNPPAAEAYDRFAESRPHLRLGAIRQRCAGWVLSLQQEWQPCTVDVGGGGSSLTLIDARLSGGMSGSPILAADGNAVGV